MGVFVWAIGGWIPARALQRNGPRVHPTQTGFNTKPPIQSDRLLVRRSSLVNAQKLEDDDDDDDNSDDVEDVVHTL